MQNRFTNRLLILILLAAISLSINADNKPGMLEKYKVSGDQMDRIFLTSSLTEISGIALTPDGRLFGHHDESSTIYEIDKLSGTIVKWFNVGESVLTEDFEDMVIFGPNFYLVTSKGDLYRFFEQPDRGYSQYKKFSTGLTVKHDVEGLCYDPVTHTLLLACKGSTDKKPDYKYVYAFDLNTKKLLTEPRFKLSLKEIKSSLGIKDFSPSGIARHPASGTFFIISANDKAIIELSADGELLSQSKLKNNVHRQPEGITFGGDYSMYICDEGAKHTATLTRYPFIRK